MTVTKRIDEPMAVAKVPVADTMDEIVALTKKALGL
jgi:hypothetical protein